MNPYFIPLQDKNYLKVELYYQEDGTDESDLSKQGGIYVSFVRTSVDKDGNEFACDDRFNQCFKLLMKPMKKLNQEDWEKALVIFSRHIDNDIKLKHFFSGNRDFFRKSFSFPENPISIANTFNI